MDELLKDKRFAHIPRDPAFKRIPRKERKVRIDKRFQSMFHDKKFKVKYTVDKRGKPIRNSSTENLKRFYALESSSATEDSESEAEDAAQTRRKESSAKNVVKAEEDGSKASEDLNESGTYVRLRPQIGNSSDEEDTEGGEDADGGVENGGDKDEDKDQEGNDALDRRRTADKKIRQRLQDFTVDYARGEGTLLSDSSSDEESSDEDQEGEADVEHSWGRLDADADRTEAATRRLAICNMDWDRVRAPDLMVLFHSFLPKGGVIHSVTVYPSEYGLQRMQEEEEKGPAELRGEVAVAEEEEEEEAGEEATNRRRNNTDEEGVEGSEYQKERLRQYQLNRLRYYYAVVECDSAKTAEAIYSECDGREYESSAALLDLRFVPDDMTFDQAPREACGQLPDMQAYAPELFVTTALQQSRVRLTWDETDPRRLQAQRRLAATSLKAETGPDPYDPDLRIYLASSGDESADEAAGAEKYRSLLLGGTEAAAPETKAAEEMQVSWGVELQERVAKRLRDSEAAPGAELTPFQQALQRRRERRHQHKQQVQANAETKDADISSDDDVPSDVDMEDPYFKEEFQTEEFAQSKGSQKKGKKEEKRKKKKRQEAEEPDDEESRRKKAELELLVMDADDGRNHFNLKDILAAEAGPKGNRRRKKRKEEEKKNKADGKDDDFKVDVKDGRFSALFTSHLYNIDPADPHYKRTRGMEALRQERLSRRPKEEEEKEPPQVPANPELSRLVQAVKSKVQVARK